MKNFHEFSKYNTQPSMYMGGKPRVQADEKT